jgi:hypothetical protein
MFEHAQLAADIGFESGVIEMAMRCVQSVAEFCGNANNFL